MLVQEHRNHVRRRHQLESVRLNSRASRGEAVLNLDATGLSLQLVFCPPHHPAALAVGAADPVEV